MNVRHTVIVGQEWISNDPRRARTIVRVERIISFETGLSTHMSRITREYDARVRGNDRVQVRNLETEKRTTIRRDQFTTGVRGWTLHKEA